MPVHEITIGDIKCAVLLDSEKRMTSEETAQRYPGKTAAEIEAAAQSSEIDDSCNLLYIESGGQRILADVGFGVNGPPGSGQLDAALASMNIAPADIDIVYLTHFHGDHIAGLFDAEGAERFPNAIYGTTKAEWDEWMGKWASAGDAQYERFTALCDRFRFFKPGEPLAPGVTVVDLAGHTQGHSGLLIESGGQRLIHLVDLLHGELQFRRLDWHFVFDSDGAAAVDARRHVLAHCADEALLCLFYHLKFPGLGYVRRDGDEFAFEPI